MLRLKHLSVEDIVAFSTMFVQDVINSMQDGLLLKLCGHDIVTYQHSVNVACLACVFGVQYGITNNELRDLVVGALLHDLGKFTIPLDILNKNSTLSKYEYDVIKRHPLAGVSLFRSVGGSSEIVESIILEHHENYDGTGYPCNKKGSQLSVYSQIVHMCDVYEALCAVRAYKLATPKDVARHKMYQANGTMFNPELLAAFMRTMPIYVAGEVLSIHGNTGLVISDGREHDALIVCNNAVLSVTEFYNMQNFKMNVS